MINLGTMVSIMAQDWNNPLTIGGVWLVGGIATATIVVAPTPMVAMLFINKIIGTLG